MSEPGKKFNEATRIELYKRALADSPDKADDNAIHEGAWLYYRYGYEDEEQTQPTKGNLQKPE